MQGRVLSPWGKPFPCVCVMQSDKKGVLHRAGPRSPFLEPLPRFWGALWPPLPDKKFFYCPNIAMQQHKKAQTHNALHNSKIMCTTA